MSIRYKDRIKSFVEEKIDFLKEELKLQREQLSPLIVESIELLLELLATNEGDGKRAKVLLQQLLRETKILSSSEKSESGNETPPKKRRTLEEQKEWHKAMARKHRIWLRECDKKMREAQKRRYPRPSAESEDNETNETMP